MPQSLAQNYIHLVFSTKNLSPLIKPPFENELYKYMSGICKGNESPALKIGGHLNHVHVLCRLSKKIALMDFIQILKSRSSKWMKMQDVQLSNFYWQDGYGAFSVSSGHVDKIVQYIANQHEHHKQVSFKEEYVELLNKYNVEYNSEYLW